MIELISNNYCKDALMTEEINIFNQRLDDIFPDSDIHQIKLEIKGKEKSYHYLLTRKQYGWKLRKLFFKK